MDLIVFGSRIREQRELQKLRQQDLAEMAEISNVHISEIERGKKIPSLDAFVRIIKALKIPADFVLRDELDGSSPIILNDITEKMKDLTPEQLEFITDLFNVTLKNFANADRKAREIEE